jgi:hypothetical protein
VEAWICMTNEPKPATAHESEASSPEEQNRRERRKLFVHALVGVPVVITIMAKPAWAVPGSTQATVGSGVIPRSNGG